MADELPSGATLTGVSAAYNDHTIPRELRVLNVLDEETWGVVAVDEGEVLLCLETEANAVVVTPARPALIPAGTPYCLKSTGNFGRFRILYHHAPRISDGRQLARLLSRDPAAAVNG